MRVLLDESLPRDLAHAIAGHEIRTVQEEGWAGWQNRQLLRAAAASGFTAFITADRGIEHQQNLALLRTLGIGIVIIRARSTRMEDLLPTAPSLMSVLPGLEPGTVVQVGLADAR